MYLGVDTGGTFTDFVLVSVDAEHKFSIRTHKVLSTPQAPERAILQGITELGLDNAIRQGQVQIVHGSTVATNAALENKGLPTVFITNRGFRDMLSIGRQTRPQLFTLEPAPVAAPVPPELCLEINGRVDAQGTIIEPLEETDLESLAEQCKTRRPHAIAINLLFSFLNLEHETRIAEHLRQILGDEVFICRSSDILPEYREYERGIATWLNASLGPLVQRYLLNLQAATRPCSLSIMQSNGGTMAASQAAERAVNLLLSGPAGGLAAARHLGETIGEPRLMTFDMGGTSTDVALIDGKVELTTEGRIGPWPVAVPMVDMHTIGAGGGSIADIDAGQALQVGPESAGANPGPACYGKGGTQATVTDANLLLGRLPATLSLAGSFQPDLEAAGSAVQALAEKLMLTDIETASGIIRLANEHMARALRVISVERGHNPKDFRLCCFGGAGGLHICALADALQMDKALVPANAGVLSALGMLLAPAQRQLSRTYQVVLAELDQSRFDTLAAELEREGRWQLEDEHISPEQIGCELSVDLRYAGQSAWLNVPWQCARQAADDFHRLHARRYGHTLQSPVELVNLRLAVRALQHLNTLVEVPPRPAAEPIEQVRVAHYPQPVPVYDRNSLGLEQAIDGPAIMLEPTATTFIDSGWQATQDKLGNLLLQRISGTR